MIKIRFSGLGGQGIVKVGYLLGNAAVLDGKNAVQTRSYGSAYRGTTCKSDVIISDSEIYEIEFHDSDILVCFSQEAYDYYNKELKHEGKLFIDEDLVKTEKTHQIFYRIPATSLSYKYFSKDIFRNIIILGYLIAVTELVSKKSVEKVISQIMPQGTKKLNLQAFEIGYKQGFISF